MDLKDENVARLQRQIQNSGGVEPMNHALVRIAGTPKALMPNPSNHSCLNRLGFEVKRYPMGGILGHTGSERTTTLNYFFSFFNPSKTLFSTFLMLHEILEKPCRLWLRTFSVDV